ncbi:protein KHNYN-like [Anopheles cruzii]|uniref:protein KHNYN-like n=1 Tax=Anopheles cruzii TaxID=68878 RepID=UPI0022EC5596|nr:protein KHNYN-like [Anopheles cruzii]
MAPRRSNSKLSKVSDGRKRPEKTPAAAKRKPAPLATKWDGRVKKKPRNLTSPARTMQASGRGRLRPVILDACNISFVQRYMPRFSVNRLRMAIEYFKKLGHEVHAVFPRFHLYTNQWNDVGQLKALYKSGYLVVTPCKESPNPRSQVYEDRVIVEIAHRFNCAVISNDQFRDIAHENPNWSVVAARNRIPFDWLNNDTFSIPNSGFRVLQEGS